MSTCRDGVNDGSDRATNLAIITPLSSIVSHFVLGTDRNIAQLSIVYAPREKVRTASNNPREPTRLMATMRDAFRVAITVNLEVMLH